MPETPTKTDPRMERCAAEERRICEALVAAMPPHKAARIRLRYEGWITRAALLAQHLAARGCTIPDGFLAPYPLPPQEFEASGTQYKYRIRAYNMLRELARFRHLCPELLAPDRSHSVLDLSPGSCASYEVLRHYNNAVTVADFLPRAGRTYGPFHKWLGIVPVDFDGAALPYGFGDGAFDHVLCFQAIDAYGPPERWPDFLREMLRIARRKVVLVFNPDPARRIPDVVALARDLDAAGVEHTVLRCPDTDLPALVLTREF